MQEVNLGRKSLLVLKKPFLCHYTLGLRISIGEENQCVACRLYRAVLLIYAFVLNLYIIIFLQPSKHTNPQRTHMQVSLSLFHYIVITPLKSVGVVYVQMIIHFGSYNPNHTECSTAGF